MSLLEKAWLTRGLLACLLWPVSLVYRCVLAGRKFAFHLGWIKAHALPLPVVVVGNLSVGGTGKTPLCGFLVEFFRQQGWQPGIVSRGYGGTRRTQPHLIVDTDIPEQVGDEPLMLFRQTQAPVCVCVHRAQAVEHLATQTTVDIVFSDDGLQHLSMSRDAEIIVIDGQRGLGNRWLLPAGPLRESPDRLATVDIVAIQSTANKSRNISKQIPAIISTCERAASLASVEQHHDQALVAAPSANTFCLNLTEAVCLVTGARISLADFHHQRVYAMAGIGHPERFFESLAKAQMSVVEIKFPDHYRYSQQDLEVEENLPVLVTSKDAVKLRTLEIEPMKVFEVLTQVEVSSQLGQKLEELERALRAERR